MTEASDPGVLAALVEPFAEEISAMLAGTLDGLEGTVEKEFIDGQRAVITLRGPAHGRRAIARVAGRRAATVFVSIGCRLDSAGTYLAVTKSTYASTRTRTTSRCFGLSTSTTCGASRSVIGRFTLSVGHYLIC